MRVVCIWRRESDYGRIVEEWIHEFERRTGAEVEDINSDSREGEGLCRACLLYTSDAAHELHIV